MKNLTDAFLSEADREKIRDAVSLSERRTSGEIVPMVVSSSYHYPMAPVLGAATLAFPLAIVLLLAISARYWMGTPSMWLFIGVFSLFFIVFHTLIDQIPAFKRLFVSKQDIAQEVEEAAVTAFFREGLYRTRDETGVLIFISILERTVWVLADRGINERVGNDGWSWIVEHIITGIKQKRQAEAICEAVAMVGDLLEIHFPVKEDDTNELRNLIIDE